MHGPLQYYESVPAPSTDLANIWICYIFSFVSNLEQKSSVCLGIKGMSSVTRVVVDAVFATLILEGSIINAHLM